jgi:hypothetical protein
MATARSRRTSDAADDISDPIGQPVEVHQQVGEAIAAALLPLLGRLVSLKSPDTASGGPSLSLVG